MISAQMSNMATNKLKSLVLPGLGEYSMGHENRAKSFFIREAVLWFICIGGRKAANWNESDYRAFAELHANVDMDDKNYIFAVDLGHYDSMDEYNEIKARKRQVYKMYEEGRGNEWQWDNTQNRIQYDGMRIESVTYGKYAQFAVGGLILHRLVSLIDVIYLERKFADVSIVPNINTESVNLTFNISLDL